MTPPDERPGDAALLLAFFLSGAAALGYELLWTRLLGLATRRRENRRCLSLQK